jgi:hypothetical protein
VTIAEGAEVQAIEDVAVGDLNGDGFPDLVAACEEAHLVYLQNPGAQARSAAWRRVVLPMTRERGSFIRVFAADLTGDGKPEVISANKGTTETLAPDGTVLASESRPQAEWSWFAVPGNPLDGAAWKEHVLGRTNVPINALPADLDGDGDVDILGGSRDDQKVVWFENLGRAGGEFREHPIPLAYGSGLNPDSLTITGFNITLDDWNDDGRLDAAMPAGGRSLVWLQRPAGDTGAWAVHLIGTIAPGHLVGVTAADLNGDGRADLVAGGYSEGPREEDGSVTAADPVGRIAWFEAPADATAPWTRHDISRRKRGMYDAFIARDMDQDGDLDLVATRGNSGELDGTFWLEQVRSAEPRPVVTPARERESEDVPIP